MSIATEITRILNAKASIKTSIENKGVTVGDGTIDSYASKIDEIQQGGETDDRLKTLIERPLGEFEIPNNVISIGNGAFYACGFNKIVIPNSVTKIGMYVFQKCQRLTECVLPDSITEIGQDTFIGCYNLTSNNFHIPTNLKVIPRNFISECEKITGTINLPSSVTTLNTTCMDTTHIDTVKVNSIIGINAMAFNYCTKLANFVIYANDGTDNLCSIYNSNVFNGTPIKNKTGYIYVPDDLVENYKTATNWSVYASQIKPLSEYVE